MVDRKSGLLFGIGAAICDDKGLVIAARAIQLPGNFSADVRELMALREGLLFAHFYNLKVEFAEMNSSSAVALLNDSKPLVGESKFLINDIKLLFVDVGIIRCLGVSKFGNSFVSKLAVTALISSREQLWLNNCSPICNFPL